MTSRRARLIGRVATVSALLALAGGGGALWVYPVAAQPDIPCEQWQQLHPGWPCIPVPKAPPPPPPGMPDPGQAPTTAPPVLPGQPNQPQGGGYGPTLGGVIPPDPGPGNGTPIVPVPGFTPPVLPGNRPPSGPANPAAPGNPAPPAAPAPADGGRPAPLPAPAAAGEYLVFQLERAARLHEQGLLSDQEFADLKQRLLNPAATPPRPQPGTPVSTDTDRGDNRVPALLLTGLTAFLSAGLRRRVRDETGTSYSLNDGTVVEFDTNGRFITPSWSDPSMGTANSVHIFPQPQITDNNPSLKGKGLPPTIEGGITFPSNPNDQMYLSRVPGPEGDNHNWYVAYTYIDPRLDDPGAKDQDGWLPYALVVQDQNGYHQVTNPPAKGSAAAAAMAAGLAMWGFQRPGTGTQGGAGRGGGRVPRDPPAHAWNVLEKIDQRKWPPPNSPGTKAGGKWENDPPKLPKKDSDGTPITYKEYDVNVKVPGDKRDSERIVIGSDGSAWYTGDHYATFERMR